MIALKLIPLRAWLAAGLIAIVAAVAWWGVGVYRDGQEAQAQVLVLQREVAAAQAALALERARTAADTAAVEEEAAAEQARQATIDAILDSINRYDPASDAPVAPVLLDTLRSLK